MKLSRRARAAARTLRYACYLGALAVGVVAFAPRVGVFSQSRVDARDHGYTQSGWLNQWQLDEASGMVRSLVEPNRFWFVNDDGVARVYAKDTTGQPRGSVRLSGAWNRDWESLAVARWRGDPWLLVADVGDNYGRYPSVWLYLVPEPAFEGAGDAVAEVVTTPRVVEVVLEDGPRDVEAVAVDADHAQVLFISKRDPIPRIYGVPLSAVFGASPVSPSTVQATRLGALHLPTRRSSVWDWLDFKLLVHGYGPTGFDISPDGRHAAILSHRAVWLYTRSDGETWVSALARPPLPLGEHGLLQSESVGFTDDGNAILLTSEGRYAPLLRRSIE
ncbi:MAG: hypothetical protein AAF460_13090 [Pseudomonadota bacterium]